MRQGNMVHVHGVGSHRGGLRKRKQDDTGILLKRTYTAYESRNCRWSVLVNGTVENHDESNLKLVKFGP